MNLKIITAVTETGAIGCDGDLIIKDAADLAHFKRATNGHVMIMGRKTFESLPGILPGRKHVILTSNYDYTYEHPQVFIVHTVERALEVACNHTQHPDPIFVIGGGQTYAAFMPYVTQIIKTVFSVMETGDTFFPLTSLASWTKTSAIKNTDRDFSIETWDRVAQG